LIKNEKVIFTEVESDSLLIKFQLISSLRSHVLHFGLRFAIIFLLRTNNVKWRMWGYTRSERSHEAPILKLVDSSVNHNQLQE